MDVYFPHRLNAIIKFRLNQNKHCVLCCIRQVQVSIFKCLFLRLTSSSYLFQTWNVYIYKNLSFKWCYLLNDFSAFIFHSDVHLLSSTFWHMLIYICLIFLNSNQGSKTKRLKTCFRNNCYFNEQIMHPRPDINRLELE